MPTLPLPTVAAVDGGDLPVSDIEDILAILPGFLKPEDPSPVRDAILAALVAMMVKYQTLSSEGVAMCDVLRSLDSSLRGLGEDRGVYQQEGEDIENYRARILATPGIVTPEAIIAAVNAILAPFTSIECQYAESVQDRWYVGTSAARNWHSYVWDSTTSMAPGYPERLYEEYADQNMGYYRPNSRPSGALVFDDTKGRMFIIRIPDIAGIGDLGGFPSSSELSSRFYVGGIGVSSGIRKIGTTAADTFNLIVSTIDRLRAHSIRFVVISDPKLK